MDFDELVGRYVLDPMPDIALTFSREADTLHMSNGQEQRQLFPAGDLTFAVEDPTARGLSMQVTFHRNDEGVVDRLTYSQGGQDVPATRTADPAPDPVDLGEYEGRYYSHEIEAFFTVVVEDGLLILRQRRMDDHALAHDGGDRFQSRRGVVQFERDADGRIIAFELGNTRTYGVRFERLE